MSNLKFFTAGLSEGGSAKSRNEDAFLIREAVFGGGAAGVFAVADGVGGLQNGAGASALAISLLEIWWGAALEVGWADEKAMRSSILRVFEETNLRLLQRRQQENIRMATTLSVLVAHGGNYYTFHIGDSRIYRVRRALLPKLEQLTQDHTCRVEKLQQGHPRHKTVLTECLGNKENYTIHLRKGPLQEDDTFLLCSDGQYKRLHPRQILRILQHEGKTPAAACRELVDTARARGEDDDISSIVLRVAPGT